jgi:hypothetical protein
MKTITIGRSEVCDIIINSPNISRIHAEISIVDGVYILRDVSASGCTVNGIIIENAEIMIDSNSYILIAHNTILNWTKIEAAFTTIGDNEILRDKTDFFETHETSGKIENEFKTTQSTIDSSSHLNNEHNKYKSIEGWLSLLCFVLIIGSPLSTLYNLVTSYIDISQYIDQFPGLLIILCIDSMLSITLMILSIRAGMALWNIKPAAVRIAKKYLLLFLGYSVIALFLPFMAGLPSESNDAMVPEIVKGAFQSILYFGIWYSYLSISKRVLNTYND